jgi:outer membrane receptor for Fe3+-dicitrate
VPVTAERPHGIRYSLTLHAPDNTRLIGFDNAHGVKPVGSRFKHVGKRFPYDHRHRHALDEGVLYEFDTAYQLVSDFYAEVDRRFEGDQSMNKVLKFGIAPVPVQRARTLAIAAGNTPTRQR